VVSIIPVKTTVLEKSSKTGLSDRFWRPFSKMAALAQVGSSGTFSMLFLGMRG